MSFKGDLHRGRGGGASSLAGEKKRDRLGEEDAQDNESRVSPRGSVSNSKDGTGQRRGSLSLGKIKPSQIAQGKTILLEVDQVTKKALLREAPNAGLKKKSKNDLTPSS